MSRNFNQDENTPLLTSTLQSNNFQFAASGDGNGSDMNVVEQDQEFEVNTNGSEDPPARDGRIVACRVCEAEISIEGKENQHVVRCQQCNEVTPIKAAPPGKKYVRCPCNCLLVCKASSNRIACPRPNCRRVITLVASAPIGTAVRAPAGTCRVQCFYCLEVFMFNALANQVANCPHCKRSSSVGARYARSRSLLYGTSAFISLILLLGVIIGSVNAGGSSFVYILWIGLIAITGFLSYRFAYYLRLKVSQVLGPI